MSLHFSAPEDDGGGAILAYECTIQPTGQKVTISGRGAIALAGRHQLFYVIDGIEAGKDYTFSLAAVNAAGVGAVVEKSGQGE